jgi:D-3-phosphoglycerate dehydrogenase / 2-oxoglutarate reductase
MNWRILVADKLAPEGIEVLRNEAEVFDQGGLQELGSIDAIVVRSATKVTSDVIDQCLPRLKVVGRAGVGVDNIDLQKSKENNVIVVNAPMGAGNAVAELVLGFIFSLARFIPEADRTMRKGEWSKKQLRGSQVAGKTLGVIGMGRIGASLAERANAIGMHSLGYDPFLDDETISNRGAKPVSLEALLAGSDYISLHVPLTPDTANLLGRDQLAKVKPGARLISTARGGVVNETALLEVLNQGIIAGAALDVFSEEPPGLIPLIEHPKVISTPHIGAQTHEAQIHAAVDIATEVLAALKGETLHWRVA